MPAKNDKPTVTVADLEIRRMMRQEGMTRAQMNSAIAEADEADEEEEEVEETSSRKPEKESKPKKGKKKK